MNNKKSIEAQIIKGLKMSDGTLVEGYVIGFTGFLYLIPREEVEKACCTGQQQIEVTIQAERILSHI